MNAADGLSPIFLIGCPRSGTTMTMRIMSCHEDLAWVSNFLDMAPNRLELSRRSRVYDLPVLGKHLHYARVRGDKSEFTRRVILQLPEPVEPWKFFNAYFANFQWPRGGNTPPRRRTPSDMTSAESENFKNAVQTLCRYQGKKRFLSKYTDFPRIQFLRNVFADARFIHITRDGRAVASSYLDKIQSGDFGTWDEREWWISGWPSSWSDEFLNEYNTPAAFVAYQWKFFLDQIWQDAVVLPEEHYLEVNYRDIVSSPRQTFSKIFDFCGLDRSPRVEWYLGKTALRNMNTKWQVKLSDEEKVMLEQLIDESRFRRLFDS